MQPRSVVDLGATGDSCPSLAQLKQVWRPFLETLRPFEELTLIFLLKRRSPHYQLPPFRFALDPPRPRCHYVLCSCITRSLIVPGLYSNRTETFPACPYLDLFTQDILNCFFMPEYSMPELFRPQYSLKKAKENFNQCLFQH